MSNNPKGRHAKARPTGQEADLRRRLEEAEQTLAAIRHGDVDGLVVAGPQGEQVYSRAGAEHVYRVIVETMHEAALTVDPNGTILFCNRRFCELMKTSIQGALGHKATAFAALPQQFALQRLLADAHLGPVRRHLLLRAADGTPVPVQLAASPLEVGDNPSICLVASDLTELEASAHSVRALREHQQALEESEARLALELAATQRLQEASTQLIGKEGAEALYNTILDAAVAIMRSDFASIQMLHPQRGPGGELQLLGHRGFNPEATKFWEWVRPASESTCGIALRTGQRVIAPDVQTCELMAGSEDQKTCLQTGIRAVQTTPLISRSGRLVGMISTHWRQPHQPTERDLRALDVLARQAADLIEHKQAQESLRNANEDLQAQAEQLQTANDLLQAKQQKLEEANKDLLTQERELVQHAKALRDSQALVRAVMDGSPDLIYVKDLDGRILMANPAACAALSRPGKEVIGQSAREFHRNDPEVGRAILENDRRIMESGQAETIEEPGSKGRTYLSTKAPYRDAAGNVIGLLGISHDITERKRAEEALGESEARYRRLFEAAPFGIGTADLAGRILSANPAMEQITGYAFEELLALGVARVYVNPSARQEVLREIRRHGRVRDREVDLRRKDGSLCHALLNMEQISLGDGQPPVLLTTLRDITAHRQAEEALRELAATLESKVAARTAELGQRAQQLQKLTLELSQAEERERRRIALILHEDLQQQIAAAKFHLNLARNRARYDPPQQALVDRVDEMLKEAIEKSRCLSHDLSPAVLHMNDLGEVLRWLAHRVREQQGLTVQVDVTSAATLPSEALTMFLFRAAQEMLFNVVKHAGVNEAALRVRHRGRCVCLRVSDRGRGFDPQEIRKTAGFGLLSIRERVELLGGRMKIQSVPGRGSVFRIVVPDGEQSGDARWKVDEAPPSSGLRRP